MGIAIFISSSANKFAAEHKHLNLAAALWRKLIRSSHERSSWKLYGFKTHTENKKQKNNTIKHTLSSFILVGMFIYTRDFYVFDLKIYWDSTVDTV